MASYTSSLIIKLIDQATAPARAISKALEGVKTAQQRNNRALAAARGGMVEAAAMGFTLYHALKSPLSAAIEFESKLEDIAQKVDVPISALGELGDQIKSVARYTTKSATEIAEGMDVLAGMGANRSDALEMLKPIGRAAVAYKASIADLAQAGYSALSNLKVPADQFGQALDAMAEAGKAGAFELKDMAQYFPTLGAGYQALGQTGVSAVADLAAALQVVRTGTGDSASAATNLANILQKMNSPLTEKNFAKMGINLQKELKKATKLGMSPIEAITEITNRTLKGDMSKLGYLFNDAQVQQGMRPLLQNLQMYRDIRKQAMTAQGSVEEDYQRRLKTGEMAAQRFKIAVENVKLAIGTALMPALVWVVDKIEPFIGAFREFAEQNPGVIRAIILTTAALIALRVAALGGRYGWLLFQGSLLSAKSGLLAFSRIAVSGMLLPARALMALRNPIGLIAKAFGLLRVALISTGVGAIIAAIAMAGVWVYNNWEGVSTAFIAFKDALSGALGPIMPLLQPVIDGIKWVWNGLTNLLAPIDATKEQWAEFGTKAGLAVGNVIRYIVEFGKSVIGGFSSIYNSAGSFLSRLFNACKNVFQSIPEALRTAGRAIIGILTGLPSYFFRTGVQAMRLLSDAVWNGIGIIFNFFANLPGRILTALGNLDISKSLGIDGALLAAANMRDTISSYMSSAFNKVSEFRTAIINKGGEFLEAGQALMYQLWDGIKNVMGQIVEYIKNSISNAASAAMAKIKGLFTFGSGDSPTEQVTTETGVAGARAAGGPVQAGSTYLVGETGPELFTPPTSGIIRRASDTAKILRNSMDGWPPKSFSVPQVPVKNVGSGQSGQSERSVTVNLGGITVNVPQSQNMDVGALAAKIANVIGQQVQKSASAAFSDGVY